MLVQEELKECDDLVLALIFVRRLHHVYDAGGHSMRSLRSWLLDPMLTLCSDMEIQKFDNSLKGVEEEIVRRANLQRPLQLRLFHSLQYLADEEYFCHLICATQRAHNELEDPSAYEGSLLDLIALALRSRERFGWHQLTQYSPEQLIEEGKNRYYRRSEQKDRHYFT